MTETIDCLFIGNNAVNWQDYSKYIKLSGKGVYPALNLERNTVNYQNRIYSASELLYILSNKNLQNYSNSLSIDNMFSLVIPYLATFIYRKGLTYDFVNSFQKDKDELASKLKKYDIKAIAITTTIYTLPYPIVDIISFIKKYNTTAKIIVGGPFINTYVSTVDDESLEKLFKYINADIYINSAQGEDTLAKLLHSIKNGSSIEDINNIYFRNADGYVKNPTKKENNSLNDNYVDWSLFKGRIEKLVTFRTSTSCCFKCSFCEYPTRAGNFQSMSIHCIEKEMDALNAIDEVETLCFIDDTFNMPKDRFKEILRMMIKKKYKFNWTSYFRCQFADDEMLELMKQSGCRMVFLGIESASNKVLKNMNKAVTVDKYINGVKLLHKYKIPMMASYIIGFPGETTETWAETLTFIEEYKPTFNTFEVWYCSKLAPIWKQREKFKIEGKGYDWVHETMDSTEACKIYSNVFESKRGFLINQLTFEDIVLMLNAGISISDVCKYTDICNSQVIRRINDKKVQVDDDTIDSLKKIISDKLTC